MKRKKLFDIEIHNENAPIDGVVVKSRIDKRGLRRIRPKEFPLLAETRIPHFTDAVEDEKVRDVEELLWMQLFFW